MRLLDAVSEFSLRKNTEATTTTKAEEAIDAIRSTAMLPASASTHPETQVAGGQYVDTMPTRD